MDAYNVREDPRMVAAARIVARDAPPMAVETARTIARILGPALSAGAAAQAVPAEVERAA